VSKVLIATGNAHKFEEITRILGELKMNWVSTREFPDFTDVEEVGRTFEENAWLKASVWFKNTKLFSLADDSGLEVDAMGGRPGVKSARYAPTNEERISKLLGELDGVPEEKRRARFVCVACGAGADDLKVEARGVVEGKIAFEAKGEGGFGYDPVFIPDGFGGRHMAELTEAEKDSISHRGLAFRALLPELRLLLNK